MNDPPATLQEKGQDLWKRVLGDFDLAAAELALLEAACMAYDRLTTAQAAIERDGLCVDGRYGPRAHPMAAIVRDSSSLLARCLRQLDVALDDEAPRPARLGAKPGPKARKRAS